MTAIYVVAGLMAYLEAVAEKLVRTRRRNPEKARAWSAVASALQGGRLIRPTCCEVCATETSQLQAHHDDYSKPLDVRWLCRSCHLGLHGKELRIA